MDVINDFLEGLSPSDRERAEEYIKLRMMSRHDRRKPLLHGPPNVVLEWSDEYLQQFDTWISKPERGVTYTIIQDDLGLFVWALTTGIRYKKFTYAGQGIPTLERAKEICTTHYNQVMR